MTGTGTSGTLRAYRSGTVPGTYAVDVRTTTANLTVTIAVGSVIESVVIPVY